MLAPPTRFITWWTLKIQGKICIKYIKKNQLLISIHNLTSCVVIQAEKLYLQAKVAVVANPDYEQIEVRKGAQKDYGESAGEFLWKKFYLTNVNFSCPIVW